MPWEKRDNEEGRGPKIPQTLKTPVRVRTVLFRSLRLMWSIDVQ